MQPGIHILQIVQEQIGIGQDGLDGGPGSKARGVNGRVDALRLALLEDLQQKLVLAQALTAGDGHAAAGALEEGHVPSDALHNLFQSVVRAAHVQSLGGADLGALAAVVAVGAVRVHQGDLLIALQVQLFLAGLDAVMGTYVQTVAAFLDAHALDLHPVELRGECLGLGAVAPEAVQGAALHKQGQPDAGAVVYGKALHIVKLTGKLLFLFHVNSPLSSNSCLPKRRTLFYDPIINDWQRGVKNIFCMRSCIR